jgi:hypothetical protein
MRIIRRPAVQGHAVPVTAYTHRPPFAPEILAGNPVEGVPLPDDDPRLNAQNNYLPPRMMRCTYCETVMSEDETDDHRCGD